MFRLNCSNWEKSLHTFSITCILSIVTAYIAISVSYSELILPTLWFLAHALALTLWASHRASTRQQTCSHRIGGPTNMAVTKCKNSYNARLLIRAKVVHDVISLSLRLQLSAHAVRPPVDQPVVRPEKRPNMMSRPHLWRNNDDDVSTDGSSTSRCRQWARRNFPSARNASLGEPGSDHVKCIWRHCYRL